MASPLYSVDERIAAVRSDLVWWYPFFSSILLNRPLRRMDAKQLKYPTMATDGKEIIYCDEFILGHTRPQLLFAFCHECIHITGGHHARRGTRNEEKWNKATDFSINDILVRGKVGELKRMPDGTPCWLYHPKFEKMSPEEIYHLLPDPPAQDGSGGGKGDPDLGDIYAPGRSVGEVMDGCDLFDEAEVAKLEAEITIINDMAKAVMARRPGKMSADMIAELTDFLDPVIDWKGILQRFLSQMSRDDYSWARPNRRYLSLGFTLPSLYSEIVRHLVILADASGSIYADPEAIMRICSEVNAAFGDGRIDKITFVCVDTKITNVQVFERGEEFKPEIRGGGGTAFGSAMRKVAQDYPDAQAAIFFTDMYVSDFGPEPPFPVLWAIVGDKQNYKRLAAVPPYGECIPCYK